MRRFAGASVIAAVVAVALSGCGASLGSPTDEFESVDPAHLVGLWKVDDAAGAGTNTWVRLARGVTVWTDCGEADGSWAADDDAFVADLDSWAGDGCTGDDFPDHWLRSATGYGYVDGDLSLLSRAGVVLATLTPGTPPFEDPDEYATIHGESLQPDVTDPNNRPNRGVVPLPDGVRPAGDITGRWYPSGDADGATFVDFGSDRSYSVADTCAGSAGRWTVSGRGSLLLTSLPVAAIACAPVDTEAEPEGVDRASGLESMHHATTVGMNGDELTFYGPDGEVIATLLRE